MDLYSRDLTSFSAYKEITKRKCVLTVFHKLIQIIYKNKNYVFLWSNINFQDINIFLKIMRFYSLAMTLLSLVNDYKISQAHFLLPCIWVLKSMLKRLNMNKWKSEMYIVHPNLTFDFGTKIYFFIIVNCINVCRIT